MSVSVTRVRAHLVLSLLAIPGPARAQTVWLGPVTDQMTPQGFFVNPDYQELFGDAAPWPRALSHTPVFEIDRRYIATQPEANLRRIFSFLPSYGIMLAMIVRFVESNNCGLEGRAHRPDENLLDARRAKRLGGEGCMGSSMRLDYGATMPVIRVPANIQSTKWRQGARSGGW